MRHRQLVGPPILFPRTRFAALLAGAAGVLFAPGLVAQADAADFIPAPGAYTVDTSALTLMGPGTSLTGTAQAGVAVFSFDNVDIPEGAKIRVQGSRPFKLVAAGNLTLADTIDGSGTSASNLASLAYAGGPGGGKGGASFAQPGQGTGGGRSASNGNNGGGGGGFGGAGARGGVRPGDPGTAGAAGPAYGNLNAALEGGSGGAGASVSDPVGGGGGGGAIALLGSSVHITATGAVSVNGGGGAVGGFGASGGGSGGGIIIGGATVNVAGLLTAAGGQGGAGGCCGDGGGGGGGRITYQYKTLVSSGTMVVTGGTSGTRSTTGAFSSGGASPDATGAPGAVTKIQAPSVAPPPAPPAPSVTPTIALFTSSPSSVSASKKGSFKYSFLATPLQKGAISLKSAKKIKIGSKKRVMKLAAKSFTVPATGKVKVTFKLSSKNLKALKRAKKLRFKVTVTLGGKTFASKLTVKAPKQP